MPILSGLIEGLIRIAAKNQSGCLVCRRIIDGNSRFAGELVPIIVGTMTLTPASQLLHLRSCTARGPIKRDRP